MKPKTTYRAMAHLYDTVDELPAGAMTVKEYADECGYTTTSYIYHLIKRGKADFKIVIFHGTNFVVKDKLKAVVNKK